MTRKRYKKLLMSYRLPAHAAGQLADVRLRRCGRYGMTKPIPGDGPGFLAFADELRTLGYVRTLTIGVMWMTAAGLKPPTVPRAK